MLGTNWVSSRLGAKRTLVAGLAIIVVFSALAGCPARSMASSPPPPEGSLAPSCSTRLRSDWASRPDHCSIRHSNPRTERRCRGPLKALTHRGLLTMSITALLYNWGFLTMLGYAPFPMKLSAIQLGFVFLGWGVLVAFFSVVDNRTVLITAVITTGIKNTLTRGAGANHPPSASSTGTGRDTGSPTAPRSECARCGSSRPCIPDMAPNPAGPASRPPPPKLGWVPCSASSCSSRATIPAQRPHVSVTPPLAQRQRCCSHQTPDGALGGLRSGWPHSGSGRTRP